MKVMSFFSKCLVVLLTVSLILPVNLASAAEGAVQTKMKHESPDTFVPGFRIILEAKISDEAGIKEARCYFKAKDSAEFIFVDMQKADGGLEAILPAPDLGVRAVNYFFLSLNGKNKVARSQVFEIVEQDTDSAKDLKEAEQAKAKGKDIDLDNVKDRLMEKLEKEQKAKLKKHQTVKKDGTIKAKTDASEPPAKVKGFRDKIEVVAVAPALQYSMMKEGTATVTATSGGIGAGAVIAGLAVIAGGAALAGGGGGGGGSSSGGTTPPPTGGGVQLGGVVTAPNGLTSQQAPYFIQIINTGGVTVPLAVTYNGASLGTYTGTGIQDFPITFSPAATGRLTLTQAVTGAQVNVHFRTNGGQAVVAITGSANDYIVFRTE